MHLFDFHSHILPALDDGSASVEESMALLLECKRQGIASIAATPHFYADKVSPEVFLLQRQQAFEKLNLHQHPHLPAVVLGAEVQYYDGISHSKEILKLRMEGTKVLLLEMPQTRWTHHMCQEVLLLNHQQDVRVLLAHMERYWFTPNQKCLEWMHSQHVFFQANGSFFVQRQTRKKALQLLKNGMIDVLGSDCHNQKDRRPNLEAAQKMIAAALGQKYLDRMTARQNQLLQP